MPTEMFLPMVDQSAVDSSTEEWLDRIEDTVNYKVWYCGHWHTDKRIDKMHFLYKTFECLTACKKALDTGGTATAVVNGANEEANALFRQGKISFLEIGSLVTESLNAVKTINQKNVEDVLNADALAREFVRRTVNK